jgi:hypothetical protein
MHVAVQTIQQKTTLMPNCLVCNVPTIEIDADSKLVSANLTKTARTWAPGVGVTGIRKKKTWPGHCKTQASCSRRAYWLPHCQG